jgi:prophage endopeptidase
MNLPSVIPLSWKIGAALVLVGAVVAGGAAYRSHVYHAGYDQAVTDRAAADLKAVTTRIKENAALATKQDATNVKIEKAKNEELAPVIRTIYVDRVRVGTGVCGPSSTAKTEDATSSNSADPGTRLVSEGTEADIRALTVRVEEALATGRACQAFGKDNGFIP